jgi:hypothetical protein
MEDGNEFVRKCFYDGMCIVSAVEDAVFMDLPDFFYELAFLRLSFLDRSQKTILLRNIFNARNTACNKRSLVQLKRVLMQFTGIDDAYEVRLLAAWMNDAGILLKDALFVLISLYTLPQELAGQDLPRNALTVEPVQLHRCSIDFIARWVDPCFIYSDDTMADVADFLCQTIQVLCVAPSLFVSCYKRLFAHLCLRPVEPATTDLLHFFWAATTRVPSDEFVRIVIADAYVELIGKVMRSEDGCFVFASALTNFFKVVGGCCRAGVVFLESPRRRVLIRDYAKEFMQASGTTPFLRGVIAKIRERQSQASPGLLDDEHQTPETRDMLSLQMANMRVGDVPVSSPSQMSN